MNPELPTTLISLAGYTVFVAAPLAAALIKIRIELKAASARATETRNDVKAAVGKIDEMHEQVRNDHPQQPNLRHDLDLTLDAAADIYAIVRDMQDRQIAQDAKLDAKLDALRADLRGDVQGLRTDMTEVSRELHDERKRSIEADESLWRAIPNRRGQHGGSPTG